MPVWVRRALRVGMVGAAAMWVLAPLVTTPTHAEDRIQLAGSGSVGMLPEMGAWGDALAAAAPMDVSYLADDDVAGRDALIAGTADFAVSGTPFTADQLAKVPGGASAFAKIPIGVTGIAFTMSEPYPAGFTSFTPPPDQCFLDPNFTPPNAQFCDGTHTHFDGPWHVPVANLAAMALDVQQLKPGAPANESSWNHPDVVASLGITIENKTRDDIHYPVFVNRISASATNYYLQTWAKTAAPDVWHARVTFNKSQVQWEPITERFPKPSQWRPDVLTQAGDVTLWLDLSNNSSLSPKAGIMADLPPWGPGWVANKGGEKVPGPQKIRFDTVPLQNADHEWVMPTSDSLTKAVELGGETPLWALTNTNAQGAYPLAWVDYLYAPKTAMDIDKLNALAAFIRHGVTTGVHDATAAGDGHLSTALTTQALTATNDLVRSNCTGPDRILASVDSTGNVRPVDASTPSHATLTCTRRIVVSPTTTTAAATTTIATTTTTTAATTTSSSSTTSTTVGSSTGSGSGSTSSRGGGGGSFGSSGGSTNTVATIPESTTVPPAESAPATSPPPSAMLPAAASGKAATALQLPFGVPGDGRGSLDRASTVMVGGGIYWVIQRSVRRRRLAAR